ncbi:MAG: cupin domain-containing protein [Deltaproteobacteria bacterium]|nr:cupin domain-containing protein [Deltaproteobacteria bacterium]MBW1919146.1 cupin domain-containing protein [Deltaproteobacteria bacterium]MBW1934181.1 cupin domain-containing protein [Deltaproteobacteria bacterium]MBW1976440.1 cupin domain-containing protein [Deltaproteobacteria bacterium]MBW2043675.1 cupin domain-containing protein [Deltaproteobacteria bacterium]
MKHIHYMDQEPEVVDFDGAEKTVIRHIITEKDGAPNFNLRVLTIEAGGKSPEHSHPWEHEFFVLKGQGIGIMGDKEEKLRPGDVIYCPPDVHHCIKATEQMEVI